MINEALGLIEVIGYPPAIEAADQALKSANVKLASITKVDGGIMTVQILGDVGAVSAAVAAGGLAASKVGPLRATHVIPRVDTALFDTVLKLKTMPKTSKGQTTTPVSMNKINTSASPPSKEVEVDRDSLEDSQTKTKEKQDKKSIMQKKINELASKSNSELRSLITTSGIDIQGKQLNTMKKQELIEMLTNFYKAEEGEV